MSDEHTPTTEEVRRMYALKVPHDQRERRYAEFDRWLEKEKRVFARDILVPVINLTTENIIQPLHNFLEGEQS